MLVALQAYLLEAFRWVQFGVEWRGPRYQSLSTPSLLAGIFLAVEMDQQKENNSGTPREALWALNTY